MAANDIHMPKTVRFAGGKARSTIDAVGLDSGAYYLGGFVSTLDGTNGAEFAPAVWADDKKVFGYVVKFHRQGSLVPIEYDDKRAGTLTAASGELPIKYAFASTNDESNTTSAKFEMLEIMPIYPGDILEVSLWGASTISVARGTTTAWGTTASSANYGVSMSVEATYHFALLESSAVVASANMDFMTTQFGKGKPANSHRVFVQCMRCANSMVVAD
jgi:hypothetical protein